MRWVGVEDEVKGIFIIRDLAAKSTEIEVILDVVLIDLAKELISPQAAKPWDPRHLLLLLPISWPAHLWLLLVRLRLCLCYDQFQKKK